MQVTKYYCDKCKEEGNIWEGNIITNRLCIEKIPEIVIDPLNETKFIIFKEMSLCEKCKEKLCQLTQELNDKWNGKVDANIISNNYTININFDNAFSGDMFIKSLTKLSKLK